MNAKVKSETSTKTSKTSKVIKVCQDEIARVRLLRILGTLRDAVSREALLAL